MNHNFSLVGIAVFLAAAPFGFAQTKDHKDYVQSISGTELAMDMVAIPEGTYTMGSAPAEKGRKADEGPRHTVIVDAFWMAKHEVTWELYNLFVNRNTDTEHSPDKGNEVDLEIDAIAGATVPYVDMSLGMGTGAGLPVGNVTQHAALAFCKWLSAKTGHFYRLPTEAEWEYAARAGTQTAYSFGDDPALLDDHAWHYQNSGGSYQPVGQKKPNPWGLYDMHGNVAEWTLDQYRPTAYKDRGKDVRNPWERPKTEYPKVVRGGSYDDDPEYLRSAARTASAEKWKMRDPQFPKSKWWNTDAPYVGFRVVRQKEVPSPQEMEAYWNQDI
ncbi:formylglycine-generating enzyme family protein [Maribacter sp. 2307ULW6-5]|uniref:formylglycine-generating enzyme family protein n=1 Tax=Maribacter sp. 2307ULW6-5 TaxID=3386275 RepID=UPI0039BD3709